MSRLGPSFDYKPTEKRRLSAHDAAMVGAQDSTGTIRKGRVVPAWYIVQLQADGEASALRSRCGYGRWATKKRRIAS
ncbi:MAG: hypothetical protein A2X66_06815 [Ignavibacteria bacterium GWA2_54_16]|nr:MAG: hypothetical protein A2X66_06815 [Ignavibacteria bacterium GWA2_54_16]